jgi:hypothetical protein
VIFAAAFCPHPPVLVPAVAQGAAPELDGLRAACVAAIRRIATPGRRLVVIGAGGSTRAYPATARGSLHGLGLPFEVPLGSDDAGSGPLPLSLTIGAWLVREALGPDSGAVGYGVAGWAPSIEGEAVLLVMGDGSARRSLAAPGYLDERAEGFDRSVSAALGSGEPAELAAVDADLGRDLLAAGVPAWHTAAALLAGRSFTAELGYDDAPYGVGYFVATWT